MQTIKLQSQSIEDTKYLGELFGRSIGAAHFIELVSDLGGGKTTLSSGIVAGLGSADPVSSPSFTICNTYSTSNGRRIYHFDFYRLDEAGIIANELSEAVEDDSAVVIVEWAGLVDGILPLDRTKITITAASDTVRNIEFSSPDELDLNLLLANRGPRL